MGIVAMDELQSFPHLRFFYLFYLSSFWSNKWKKKIILSWVTTYHRASLCHISCYPQLNLGGVGFVFFFFLFSDKI